MSRPARDKRSRPARSHQTTSSSSKRAHRSADFAEEEEQDEKTVAVAPTTSVVDVLLPVCTVFQSFLTDGDVGRLMPLSRAFTTSVLSGFRFRRLFTAKSPDHLRRLAVYEKYGLLVSCLQLDDKYKQKLTGRRGRSLLPASLLALALGYVGTGRRGGTMFERVVKEFFDRGLAAVGGNEEKRLEQLEQLLEEADVVDDPYGEYEEDDDAPSALLYGPAYSLYVHPLPPRVLPYGLLFLQLGNRQKGGLEEGSIPSTVVYFKTCDAWEQPLTKQLIPPSVKYLVLQWFRGEKGMTERRYGCTTLQQMYDLAPHPNLRVLINYYYVHDLYCESCGEACYENDGLDEVDNCVLHGHQRYRFVQNRVW